MELLICPHCKAELEAEDIAVGDAIDCPECGKTFYIERSPKVRRAKKAKAYWPCYALGVLLGFPGVFIAQATDGGVGAKYALRGAIINLAILAGLAAVYHTMVGSF